MFVFCFLYLNLKPFSISVQTCFGQLLTLTLWFASIDLTFVVGKILKGVNSYMLFYVLKTLEGDLFQ